MVLDILFFVALFAILGASAYFVDGLLIKRFRKNNPEPFSGAFHNAHKNVRQKTGKNFHSHLPGGDPGRVNPPSAFR